MSMPEVEIEVRWDPAHWQNYTLASGGLMLFNFSVAIHGWSLSNTSSSGTAEIDLYDGTDTSGVIVFPVTLAANESSREWFGERGIWFRNGLYLNASSGGTKGSVFFRRHWHTHA